MNNSAQSLLMLCFCSVVLLLTSCGNSDKKHTAEKDTLAKEEIHAIEVPSETDIQQVFKSSGLSHWQNRMKKSYPHFSTSHFHKTKKSALPPSTPQQFSEEKWQVFQPYFIIGPDQKKAIDLYSYSHLPTDSGGQLEAGSPDNEVNLVHIADRTKTRLLFAGPGTVFQQAEWLNDSSIIVTGESDANEENEMKPVLWKINIQSGVVEEYLYQDTLEKQ